MIRSRQSRTKKFKVHEVLALLEDDEDQLHNATSADIFICPPNDVSCSDEDSGDDDSGGSYNNLSGQQLQADAVLTVHNFDAGCAHIGDDSDSDAVSSDDEPLAKHCRHQPKKSVPPKRTWVEEDLPDISKHVAENFSTNPYEHFDLGPSAMFELFSMTI